MKKFMLAAVIAAVGALGVASVASAINGTQGVSAKITHNKAGTKDKPKSVGALTVTTTTTPAPNDAPFATSKAVLYFDKNLVFGGSKFKSCTTTSGASIDSTCKSSKVGSGSAKGVALGQIENLTVTAYNAAKGKKLYLHVLGTAPLVIDAVMIASLSNSSGDYGRKLTVPIPANLQQPVPNVFATLTSFITKVSGTSKGVPYVGLKGCSGGKLKFKGQFFYTDGTNKTATSTTTCKK